MASEDVPERGECEGTNERDREGLRSSETEEDGGVCEGSGEKFRRPGGVERCGKWGKWEEDVEAFL